MHMVMRVEDDGENPVEKYPLFGTASDALATAAASALEASLPEKNRRTVRFEVDSLPQLEAADMLNLAEFLDRMGINF